MKGFNIFEKFRSISRHDLCIPLVKRFLLDEMHFLPAALEKSGWRAIHAENSGQLDSEISAITSYINGHTPSSLIVSAASELLESTSNFIRVLYLDHPTEEEFSAVQLGVLDSIAPADEHDKSLAYEISFGASVSFNLAFSFLILRERDGFGWTSIAGPVDLIDSIKKEAGHGLYAWIDGGLPLGVAGGKDPSKMGTDRPR